MSPARGERAKLGIFVETEKNIEKIGESFGKSAEIYNFAVPKSILADVVKW